MKKTEEEKRREEITDHLKVIITWAAVGKDPKFYGIEQKCCRHVEMWAYDALELIEGQQKEIEQLRSMVERLESFR